MNNPSKGALGDMPYYPQTTWVPLTECKLAGCCWGLCAPKAPLAKC